METTSLITEILMDVLLGCFSLVTLSWLFVAAQTFFNDRKHEKREQEKEKRDAEYHAERMKELLKK